MSTKAILTVEDDIEALNALRMQLDRNFGIEYTLEFAQHVDEAIEVIDLLILNKVDVILLISDWYMPVKNADVLVDYIRQKNSSVRVIVLSGQLNMSKASQMLDERTIDKVIMKPWDETALIAQIRQFLDS